MTLAGRVTILLPARNEAQRIAAAIENALETGEGAPVVLVDDGSSDRTLAIAARYVPRVTLVEAEGRGLAAALNRGMAVVETPLVARADADDRSLPGRFRKQAELMESEPKLVLCATGVLEHAPSRPPQVLVPPTDPGELRRLLLRRNPLAHGATMLRVAAVRSVGGYDERLSYAQDYDLWLRLLDVGRFAVLSEILYERRAPVGSDFRRKRRGQARACARAQLRHFARTRRVAPGALLRNVVGGWWPGPRPSEWSF